VEIVICGRDRNVWTEKQIVTCANCAPCLSGPKAAIGSDMCRVTQTDVARIRERGRGADGAGPLRDQLATWRNMGMVVVIQEPEKV